MAFINTTSTCMEVIGRGSQVEATKRHVTVKLSNFQGEMALNEALYIIIYIVIIIIMDNYNLIKC